MSLVSIIVWILFVGLILWIITSAPIPINPWLRSVLIALISFFFLLWFLQALGIHTGFNLHLI